VRKAVAFVLLFTVPVVFAVLFGDFFAASAAGADGINGVGGEDVPL
jgi:hypothetical protein